MSIKILLKVCGGAAFLLLIYAALGPEKWIPRSGFGWRVDHFLGYFALTLMFCFIWGGHSCSGERGCRGAVRGLASFYAGSPCRFLCCIDQR